MKIRSLIICVIILLVCSPQCGCDKKEEMVSKETESKFDIHATSWVRMINSENSELYGSITIFSGGNSDHVALYDKRCARFPEYDYHIGSALVWNMEKQKNNSEKKFHVIISNDLQGDISEDIIKQVNEEYNLQLNMNEWVKIQGVFDINHLYYYKLTCKEIKALASKGLWCGYVGSGEGDIDDVNLNTDEGIDVLCELYGDQYIRYQEGMTIYY